jgi:hypothetical protein
MANSKIYVNMKENASPGLSSLLLMCLELNEIGLSDTLAPIFYLPGIIWILKMVG